jgi:hypothetical protein
MRRVWFVAIYAFQKVDQIECLFFYPGVVDSFKKALRLLFGFVTLSSAVLALLYLLLDEPSLPPIFRATTIGRLNVVLEPCKATL